MFKFGSVEQEVLDNMKQNILVAEADEKYNFTSIAKAAEALNKAASIFDKLGLFEQSKEITDILEDIQSHVQKRIS